MSDVIHTYIIYICILCVVICALCFYIFNIYNFIYLYNLSHDTADLIQSTLKPVEYLQWTLDQIMQPSGLSSVERN